MNARLSQSRLTQLLNERGVGPDHPGLRKGAVYYHSPAGVLSVSTQAAVANTLYCAPINLSGKNVNRLAVEVTTGVAGLCRLGVAANNDGLPGALLLDAGTVDTSVAGIVEAQVDFTFPGDWVWLLAVYNATPTMRRLGNGGDGSYLLGGTTAGTTGSGYSAPLAFGPLPAVLPASGYVLGTPPAVYARRT